MVISAIARRLALLLAVAGLLASCSGDEPATVTSTQPAGSTPALTPSASPDATQRPDNPIVAPGITGLFVEPLELDVDQVLIVSSIPTSNYAGWDRQTVTVYDTAEGQAYAFEPGFLPSMSPDGSKLIYSLNSGAGPGRVILIDWATQERSDLDANGFARFIDNDRIFLGEDDTILDLSTGDREPVSRPLDWLLINAVRGGDRRLKPTPDGQYVGLARDPGAAESSDCSALQELEAAVCRQRIQEDWALIDSRSGAPLLKVRALRVIPAGPGALVVATSPQCDSIGGKRVWCGEAIQGAGLTTQQIYAVMEQFHATTNLFRVDIATGRADFIATLAYDPFNWPLVANERYVAWTESYCVAPVGKTRVYDSETGQITELDASFWLSGISPDGHLGVGEFGPRALLSLATLNWDVVLPDAAVNVSWTPDYRLAYVGATLGQGGYCP